MAVVTKAQIIKIKNISDDVREYILRPEKYSQYEAGQFLQLTLNEVNASDYWPESRTFSIASYKPKEKTLRLIIKRVGIYTNRIFNELTIGNNITIKYAYGDFTLPLFDTTNDIVCIAGGTGITPFLSFIDALEEENSLERMRLFYSVKTKEDAIDLYKLNEKLSKFKLFTTREEHEDTINRRIEIDDILCKDELFKDFHYYICGSNEFINQYKQLLKSNNIPNIYTDEWK